MLECVLVILDVVTIVVGVSEEIVSRFLLAKSAQGKETQAHQQGSDAFNQFHALPPSQACASGPGAAPLF